MFPAYVSSPLCRPPILSALTFHSLNINCYIFLAGDSQVAAEVEVEVVEEAVDVGVVAFVAVVLLGVAVVVALEVVMAAAVAVVVVLVGAGEDIRMTILYFYLVLPCSFLYVSELNLNADFHTLTFDCYYVINGSVSLY